MASHKNKTSKLGRNPFEVPVKKKTKSQVGRMIEASFTTPNSEEIANNPDPSLVERFQDMKVSLDFKELFRSIVKSSQT